MEQLQLYGLKDASNAIVSKKYACTGKIDSSLFYQIIV